MFENVRITKLQNGACVATCEMPGVNSCSVCFSIPMGSRREKLTEAGWSHFAEHMAFRGSVKYPTGRIINRAFSEIGGRCNAYTSNHETMFHVCVPAKWTAKAIDVLGDIVTHPIYPDAVIETERKVILEEMKGDLDKSSSRLFRLENKALWPRHSLGNPILGSAKSLLKIDREALLAFHERHYTAQGAIFVAAGNLNHNRIVDMASPALNSLSDKSETTFRAASRSQPVNPVVFEYCNETRVKFRILSRLPNDDIVWNARSNILLNILGSRLFQAVRRKHGLAYSISSYNIRMYSDVTVFVVDAEVDVNNLAKVIILCGRELRKMVENPVSRRELKHAKNCLINGELLNGEDSYSRMRLLEHFLSMYGSVITTSDMIKRYESVTAQEIQQFAAEIFRPENGSLVMLLPNDCQVSPEKLRELLGNELQ